MIEAPSLTGAVVALLIPWFCGASLVALLMRPAGLHCIWTISGHGFFIGMLITTVLLRCFDALGLPLSFIGINTLMIMLGLAGLFALRRQSAAQIPNSTEQAEVPAWHWALAGLLLAWVTLRYGLMARELLLRPLFAWDAWMNWAPKAVTWFHQGTLVPFVGMWDWSDTGNQAAYTLGNARSSTYPEAVPLIQLWFMLGAGTWEHGLVYITWIVAPLALGMALYGHLRRAGFTLLTAIAVVYLVINMPFPNVHSVLAGYADIWMAAVFSLAIFALREWRLSRHWAWATLFLVMTVYCTQLKNPGIVIAMILLVCGLRELLRLPWWVEVSGVLTAAVAVIVVLGLGVQIPVPLLGTIGFADGELQAGRLGNYHIQFHPEVAGAIAKSFYQAANWNLLFYYLPVLVLVLLWQRRKSLAMPSTELLAVLGSTAFLICAFFFSERYRGALNFSTLNRAILYAIPGLVFCMAIAIKEAADDAENTN